MITLVELSWVDDFYALYTLLRMRPRIQLVAIMLILLSFSASAQDIWRCERGGEVRFEQKQLHGYACRQPSLSRAVGKGRNIEKLASRSGAAKQAASAPLSPTVVSPSLSRRGAIYKRTVNGVVEYSSKPVGGAKIVARFVLPCYACRMGKSVNFGDLPLDTSRYASSITTLANNNSIDPAWVRAIVHAESNFNPNALSPKGAQGLMQLMPATARRFGVSSPFDPAQNLAGGVQYLAWLLKRFKGDHALATAAYNAGEGAVDKYKGIPPYSETQVYVQRVSTLRSRYSSL